MKTESRIMRSRRGGIVSIAALASIVAILGLGGPLAHGVPLVHRAPQAARSFSCAPDPFIVGWHHLGLPAVGTTEGLYISLQRFTRYSGSIRGYIKYSNSLGDSLIAGILNTGSGPQAYIEANGVFHGKWAVSTGTAVHIWITHDSPADFTAHVGGFGSYQGVVHSSSTYDPIMNIESKSQLTSTGTCNDYVYYFTGLEPLQVPDMDRPVEDDAPYYYDGIADNEFHTYLPLG